MVATAELVIHPAKDVIIVFRLQDTHILWRDSQRRLGRIDQVKVIEKHSRVGRRLAAPLALIVREEEALVLAEGSPERGAELVLPQHVRLTLGLQERSGVEHVVLKILVQRPM